MCVFLKYVSSHLMENLFANPTFINSFEEIIDKNNSLADVEKFYYLTGLPPILESPGKSWNLKSVRESPGKSWNLLYFLVKSWKCPGNVLMFYQ